MDAPVLNLLSDFDVGDGIDGEQQLKLSAMKHCSGPQKAVENITKKKVMFETGSAAESTLPLSNEEELLLDLACSGVASTLTRGNSGGSGYSKGVDHDEELDDFCLDDLFLELDKEQQGASGSDTAGGDSFPASDALGDGLGGLEELVGVEDLWHGGESDDEDELFFDCTAELMLKSPLSPSSTTGKSQDSEKDCCHTPPVTSKPSITPPPPVQDSTVTRTPCDDDTAKIMPSCDAAKTAITTASSAAAPSASGKECLPTSAICGGYNSDKPSPVVIDVSTADDDSGYTTSPMSAWSFNAGFPADESAVSTPQRDGICAPEMAALTSATTPAITADKLAQIEALSKRISEVISSSPSGEPAVDNDPVYWAANDINVAAEEDTPRSGPPTSFPSPTRSNVSDSSIAKPDSPPGVPTKVLNEAQLFKSAKILENRKHSDGSRSIKAVSSANKARASSKKKKKNEFGKRRRSSGGASAGPPNLNEIGCSLEGLVVEDEPTDNGSGAVAGRKVKIDPLKALKDARFMSRKPLILQWLKSDGCELGDSEAEAVLTKNVGSLSAIHRHYWGGGG